MSLAQKFARTFGAIYVLVGVLGFVSLVGGTTSQKGTLLLGIFGITLVHNVVHIGVGAAFLAGSSTDQNAKMVSLAIGAVYVLVGLLGLLNIGFFETLLNDNLPDVLLHFATGGLALAIGSGKLQIA